MKTMYVVVYQSGDMKQKQIEGSFNKLSIQNFIHNLIIYETGIESEILEVLVKDEIDEEEAERKITEYFHQYLEIPKEIK